LLDNTTATPGMTASELSVIEPLIAPTPCAPAGNTENADNNNPNKVLRANLLARMIDSFCDVFRRSVGGAE
jgi:hypothetical protein